jgi:ribonuclease-3
MTTDNSNIKELELKLNIQFQNRKHLIEALTHSSYTNQNKNLRHNERLEFLGDSILQLCISEYLYKNYNEKSEGELTRARALIVCENSLYDISQSLCLGKHIFMSKGEELTGGRERVSILADCVEALIAAIYLDAGLERTRQFIIDHFENTIEKAIGNELILDYKTKLQEILQQKGEVLIKYNLLKFEGPPHRRKFFTEVEVENRALGIGCGYSKKEAEQNAAKEALNKLED